VTFGRPSALRLDEGGLTLVEVLLAVAIVGVALAGLGVVIPVAIHGVQEGNQMSSATFLAEQMMERVRSSAWTAAPAVDCLGFSAGDAAPIPIGTTCSGSTESPFPDETGGVSGHPQYQRTVRIAGCAISPCAGVTTAGLRLVEVAVAYTPLTARGVSVGPKTVRLAWLVSQK
jgi:prepilin-type N-terminal cleavage/methylation domain-containing protein